MSRIDPEYIDCLPVYIIVLMICAVALFLALYVCPKHLRLVPVVAIALNIALLGAGVGITLLKPLQALAPSSEGLLTGARKRTTDDECEATAAVWQRLLFSRDG